MNLSILCVRFCVVLLLSSQTAQADADKRITHCIQTLLRIENKLKQNQSFKTEFWKHIPALEAAISDFLGHPTLSERLIRKLYSVYPEKTLAYLNDITLQHKKPLAQRYFVYQTLTKLSRHFPHKSQDREEALKTALFHVDEFLKMSTHCWNHGNPPLRFIDIDAEGIGYSEMFLFAADSLIRIHSLDKGAFEDTLNKFTRTYYNLLDKTDSEESEPHPGEEFENLPWIDDDGNLLDEDGFLRDSYLNETLDNETPDFDQSPEDLKELYQDSILAQFQDLAEHLGEYAKGGKYAETVLRIFSTQLMPSNMLPLDFISRWKPTRKNLESDTIQDLLERIDEEQSARHLGEYPPDEGTQRFTLSDLENEASTRGKLLSLKRSRLEPKSGIIPLERDFEVILQRSGKNDFSKISRHDLLVLAFELRERASTAAGIADLMAIPKFATKLATVIQKLTNGSRGSLTYTEFAEAHPHPEQHLSRFDLLRAYLEIFEQHPNFWKALTEKTELKILLEKIANDTTRDADEPNGKYYGPDAVYLANEIISWDVDD